MNIAVETTPTKAFMSYRAKTSDLEKEIEELEKGKLPDDQEQEQVEQEVEVTPSKQDEEGLSAEEKSFKKRYGDLRRHQQQQEKKFKDEIALLKEEMEQLKTKASTGEMPRTKEQIEAWVKKYPDVAAIVKALAGDEATQRSRDIDKRLKEMEEMSAQIALERAENELRKLHPDFDSIRESDDFHNWAEDQPDLVKKALYEEMDVRATSRVIDLYKADRGIKKMSPDKNAALSVSPRSRATTPQTDTSANWWSESRVAKLSDREYAEKEEEILTAMREGKFKYDMSRKVR